MKLSTIAILILIVCAIWGYVTHQSEEPEPVVQEEPAPKPAPVPVPEPEPAPVPRPAPAPEPEVTVEDRLREVLALQKDIVVPHELPDGSAKVIRLEPDGIHLQKSSGIGKLRMEEMPEPLRNMYHVHKDTGDFYRTLARRRMAEAQRVQAEQSMAMKAAAADRRDADSVAMQAKTLAKAQANRDNARRQWEQYDREWKEYLMEKEYKLRLKESGKIVTMPKPPRQPSVPRP